MAGERVTDRRGRVTWLEAAGPLASPEGAAGWAQEGNSLDLTEPNNAPPHRARARPGRRWSLLPPGGPGLPDLAVYVQVLRPTRFPLRLVGKHCYKLLIGPSSCCGLAQRLCLL